jgi:hypothetical protein
MYRTLLLRAAVVAAVLCALFAGVAAAAKGGAGTETSTEHEHGVVVMSKEIVNPCDGEAGQLEAIAANSVFHITTQADGDLWLTGTDEGTVTFTPSQAGGVFYSGHFTQWFGNAVNRKNEVEHFTGTFVLKGTDGSRVTVHSKAHMSTNGRGEPTVGFEVKEVHCGS